MGYYRFQDKSMLALCALLIAAVVINARDLSADDSPDTKAVVFANSQIKPWGMQIDGAPQGLLIDIQYALSLETGLTHKVLLQPYSRVIHSVYSGDVDMAVLFDARVDLSQVIKIAPIAESPVILVGKAGMDPLTSLDELTGKTVGHMRGSKYGPVFDEATHFTRVPINAMSQALSMLLRGRIDAMAGVDLTFFWAIQARGFKPTQFTPLLVISRPVVSLYMSKKTSRPELLPLYKTAMNQLSEKGIIEDIFGHNTEWYQMDGWSEPWQPKTKNDIEYLRNINPHHHRSPDYDQPLSPDINAHRRD